MNIFTCKSNCDAFKFKLMIIGDKCKDGIHPHWTLNTLMIMNSGLLWEGNYTYKYCF